MPDTPNPGGVTTPRTPAPFTGSATGEPIAGTPAADPNATPPEGGVKAPDAAAQPPEGTPTATPAADAPGGTDDPNAGRITMSEDAFASRLARAKRQAEAEARAAVLKELGIDNPEKLTAERAEHAKLKEEREKREREKLSNEERLKADFEAEKAKREALEVQLKEVKTTSVYTEQDAKIQGIGSKHIAPDFWKYARADFVEYVSGLTPAQTARLNEKDIDRWFAKFAREKPAFAHKAADGEPKKPAVKRRVIGSTKPAGNVAAPTPGKAAADPAASPQGKTIKPGQANSMNRVELNQELKRRGMSGWR
jgi:hypothetical protein